MGDSKALSGGTANAKKSPLPQAAKGEGDLDINQHRVRDTKPVDLPVIADGFQSLKENPNEPGDIVGEEITAALAHRPNFRIAFGYLVL